MINSTSHDASYDAALAIIGMSGRFPGASNVEEFWQNIAGGIKSVRFFTDAELQLAGVDPAILRRPDYVKAGGVLEQLDRFDAAFFGYTRREAELMDPQHRFFMESAWEALEDAAYNPETYPGLIGVFAGSGFSTYLANNLYYNAPLKELVSQFQIDIGNEHDSLVSAVSYKLNLKGPSVVVQTFCSTSLVAIHMACQSLLTYECDLALAGGVAITVPQRTGYFYEEGSILSPDGECRAFDAQANGSVMGDGVGVVVLKRFSEALEDGDHIYAVIRGSAVNSSGSERVSYTAPGLNGQKEVIAEALGHAGIDAETLGYIEAHGTGTPMGDAVELAAMIKAFEAQTQKKQFCAIGSVKPNVGHLDRASGVTGLIKTALALTHKQLPPSLNFEHAHPDIDLDNSPFFVNTVLRSWPSNKDDIPRRAGVSSFGLGGVNAHMLLEEAPQREASSASRPWQLLLLSAKTATALHTSSFKLASYLKARAEDPLADVAYTLQVGRGTFNHRRAVVCRSSAEAIGALETLDDHSELMCCQTYHERPVAWLFADASELCPAQIHELYTQESAFRKTLDRCCGLLKSQLDLDLYPALFPADSTQDKTLHPESARLLPFIVAYALAQLLIEWGIRPRALLGHGRGAFVAACLAGVFSLEDALLLLADRVQQMQHASSFKLHEPEIPLLSTVTGDWITAEQATSSAYWFQLAAQGQSAHLTECLECLFQKAEYVLLEVGQGQSLTRHLNAHFVCEGERERSIFAVLPLLAEQQSAQAQLLTAVGRLWLAGVNIDWLGFYAHERRLRVSLSTYPFERDRYWIDPPEEITLPGRRAKSARGKKPDIADWFYLPEWREVKSSPYAPRLARDRCSPCLVFLDSTTIGEQVASKLTQDGCTVIRVRPGSQFARPEPDLFIIRPREREDYQRLCESLAAAGQLPGTVLYGWGILPGDETVADVERFSALRDKGFYSLLFLARALDSFNDAKSTRIVVVSDGAQAVSRQEQPQPEKSLLAGACKVIAQEYMNMVTVSVDLPAFDLTSVVDAQTPQLIDLLLAELVAPRTDPVVAYRYGQRWVQTFKARHLAAPAPGSGRLRQRGVYLITGGLGKLGLVLAAYLARTVQARLVLLGRSSLPERSAWTAWLASHEASDRVSKVINDILAIESGGGEVMVARADVADEAQLIEIIGRVRERFGELHGVIHAAGISDAKTFQLVEAIDPSVCEQHFQPKVYGLLALEAALKGLDLDFCVLFSSISAVLGGLGFAAYAAANLFMDAFAQRHNRREQTGTPWISINWDAWQTEETQQGVLGKTVSEYIMTAEEGAEALLRILSGAEPASVIVSSGDLQTRIRQWILLESLHGSDESAGARQDTTGSLSPAFPATGNYERRLTEIWRQVLGVEDVGLNDNFFDLGGNSLTGLALVSKIRKIFQVHIPVVALFDAPTISTQSAYVQSASSTANVQQKQQPALAPGRVKLRQETDRQAIAIIGMSGRFPGASTIEQFWSNLRNGVESIRFFSEEELLAAGVDPDLLRDPHYVRARPVLDGIELFDAALFGYNPREAELLDPQHRLFLECSWEALEDAGYNSQVYEGLIGVFGGTNISSYLHTLMRQPGLSNSLAGLINDQQVAIATDRDSLTTTVSYRLNLRGPSFAVQTFCSTSLVAVHLACQSLRAGECDLALAGGVSVRVPDIAGHLYQEGDMESPDGHVRTFDAQARGTMFGDGVGIIVLKSLVDALADGDHIYAVIKGSAINNDGSLKVSYAAPGVAGQAKVVTEALAQAGVEAESISYVEAHGSATALGDPIEVTALTRAYRAQTDRAGYCGIGSVKTNVGHLDRASGIAGLMKTVLALQHKEMPPSLYYQTPNPEIDFASSPFYVNTRLTPWKRGIGPRRAGVSSLGMGGTNVHMIVEEAPEVPASDVSRPWQLLLLSARTESALDMLTHNLCTYVQLPAEIVLPDVAYTLQVGRRRLEHRRMLLCRDSEEAAYLLAAQPATQVFNRLEASTDRPVVFLFPDLAGHYSGLAQGLYQEEEEFRVLVDRCCNLLGRWMNQDLRTEFFLPQGQQCQVNQANQNSLARRSQTWAAMFIIEYALACLLLQWGIRPVALLGNGPGEYVAACLSGVLSLEDALMLIARLARLVQELPQAATEARELSVEDWQALRRPLIELLSSVELHAPQIPFISGQTGTWITAEQATDPVYWAQLVSLTARSATAMYELLRDPEWLTLVLGSNLPDQTLLSLSEHRLHRADGDASLWLMALPSPGDAQPESACLLNALGKLWLAGVSLDWTGFYRHEHRQRVSLPTYPFERQRYWLLPEKSSPASSVLPVSAPVVTARAEEASWFYIPSWQQSTLLPPADLDKLGMRCWLLFLDECGIGKLLAEQLISCRQKVVAVIPGGAFHRFDDSTYSISPLEAADYDRLFRDLRSRGQVPQQIVHLWSVTSPLPQMCADALAGLVERSFYSLITLAQTLGNLGLDNCDLSIVSNDMQDVTGEEALCPEKATLIGPCKVIPQEYPGIRCRSIDITLPQAPGGQENGLLQQLANELLSGQDERIVALRRRHRWTQVFEPVRLSNDLVNSPFRERGVYLITGGLGGIGLELAAYLARTTQACLVLVARTPLPPRNAWDNFLRMQPEGLGLARTINKVRELEALGARVMVMQADVTDEAQMRAVIRQTLDVFGTIHGVLHTAGVPASGLMQLKTHETAAGVLASKVIGTRVLERVLHGLPLDFLVLFSSLSSSTGGGPGQVDYCAANAFLDAYARCYSTRHGMTIAIDWGEWEWNAWDAGLEGYPPEAQAYFREQRRQFGIHFAEGMEALRCILLSRLTHVVVCTEDFPAMVEGSKQLSIATIVAEIQAFRKSQQQSGPARATAYARPILGTPYLEPENEIERQIGAIWEELLGIDQIGMHDNFFELGGHSLIGTQLIARLRRAFQIDIRLATLFDAPTVAELAVEIELLLIEEIERVTM